MTPLHPRCFDPAPGTCGLPSAKELREYLRSFLLEARVDGVVLDGSASVSNGEAEVDVVVGFLRGGPDEFCGASRWVRCPLARVRWLA